MNEPVRRYMITPKGRQVMHGPTVWCLTAHMRDVLAWCDPQVTLAELRQSMPPESLNTSLYALRDLGLIDGPPVAAPDHSQWEVDAYSRPIGPLPRPRPRRVRAAAAPAPVSS